MYMLYISVLYILYIYIYIYILILWQSDFVPHTLLLYGQITALIMENSNSERVKIP